jgi:preprotein translocase subunit SecE
MATAQIMEQEGESGNFIQRASGWPAQVKNYFEELQMEMRRVTWPSWKQVRATTAVVIAAVFAFAAYFFVVDDVVNNAINKLINAFSR